MPKPDLQKVPPFYHNYINQVKHDNLQDALEEHCTSLPSFLTAISEDKWNYRYAEGKWTVKELVQHIIDSERIFTYRALCIARNETASLPGFDENTYAAASEADKRSKNDLIDELRAVQKATILLFRSFGEEQLKREGTANDNTISVEALGFIIAGHALHHIHILKERYLS